jgi:hypothetical protein
LIAGLYHGPSTVQSLCRQHWWQNGTLVGRHQLFLVSMKDGGGA